MSPKRSRTAAALALVASIALHVALVALAPRLQRPAEQPRRRALTSPGAPKVELVIARAAAHGRQPLPLPAASPGVQRAKRRSPGDIIQHAAESGAAPSEVGSPHGLAQGASGPAPGAPRRARGVAIFAPDVIANAAAGEGALEGAALGQARLDRWTQDFAAHRRAEVEGASDAMLVLEQRMEDWFLPPVETLATASKLGLGVASSLVPTINDLALYGTQPGLPTPLGRLDLRTDRGRADARGKCLLGDCYESGHVVASLFVLIEIGHADDGAPESWRVIESSGTSSFDQEALAAVQTAVRESPGGAYAAPPVPSWSRWEFVAEANRYMRHSLLLDPTFVPPGKELESESGVLGKTTLVRHVRLVAIAYRREPR